MVSGETGASVEILVCGKPCGEFVFSVKDGVRYEPPLIEPATCRLAPDHKGVCCP